MGHRKVSIDTVSIDTVCIVSLYPVWHTMHRLYILSIVSLYTDYAYPVAALPRKRKCC
jgi:hypothetical protein